MNISSLSSGANSIDTLIKQFMVPERQPVDELEKQKKELKRRLLVFADLKSKLSSLRDKAKDFTRVGSLNTLNAKKVNLSNSTYYSVDVLASAVLGTHSLFVERLATADTGISRQLERDTVYEYAKGLQEFTLAVGDGESATISITIEDTDTHEQVMNKVADAVNASGLEVFASVIKDTSTTSRLIIKSNETGAENLLNMTEINGSNILRKLKYLNVDGDRRQTVDTKGGFLVQDVAGLDAKFALDGVNIIKGTNTISDILDGVTFKLQQVQELGDAPISFGIENDSENVKKEIENFIEKFNETITYLNAKTSVDTTTFKRGDLAGDIVFGTLKYSIRSMVAVPVSGLDPGDLLLLSQIGIELSREGTLSIKDSTKFDDALKNNIEQVTQLFAADDGIGNKLTDLLDNFVNAGGRVDRSKKSIDRRIRSIDTRIKNYEARFVIREQALRRQFTDLQRSLSLLNSQQAMMQRYQMFNLQTFGGFGY